LLTAENPPSAFDISEEGERAFNFSESIADSMRRLIKWLQHNRLDRLQSVKDIQNFLDQEKLGNIENEEIQIAYKQCSWLL